jgi:hypothetical protein
MDAPKNAWRERVGTALLLLALLMAYGVVGRMDFDDERRREEGARQVRELVLAATWCGPQPGQRAIQEWHGDQLRCTILENIGYGRAPRIAAQMELPALMHPLAMEGD